MKRLFWLMILSIIIPLLSASDPLKPLSQKLANKINAKALPSLAVLNFTYSRGRMSTGSYLVSERLLTYMVQNGASVIERRLIPQIMEERRLIEMGIIDSESIKMMGKIKGVDAILVGTLADVSDSKTEVMARVIEVNTGRILAASGASLDRLWSDSPKLPRIAQSRSPVPEFNPRLMVKEEGGLEHKLSDLPPLEKAPCYAPAPVPFFMTPISKSSHGGFFR